MNKKILITGGNGNLGKYIIEKLREKYELITFGRTSPKNKKVKFIKGNILKIKDLENACKGIDMVIHLAALLGRDKPEKIFKVNVIGTFNLLESCCREKIKRVIFASSDSCLGFVYQKRHLEPEYLPIDENHPLRPQDAYGLSKLIGEEICRSYTNRYGIETICLRPSWIWFPEKAKLYEPFVKIPEAWAHMLWVYNDPRDVAQAFRLAIEAQRIKHERIFISARDNGTKYRTFDLIKKYYPEVKKIRKSKLRDRSSLVDISKARKILGYQPKYTWRDILF